MRYRGEFWKILADRVQMTYYDDGDWPYAKKWRNRVGRARLVSDEAVAAAHQLLHDIDPRVFRADEIENAVLYEKALDAVWNLRQGTSRVSWDRVEGRR